MELLDRLPVEAGSDHVVADLRHEWRARLAALADDAPEADERERLLPAIRGLV